MNFRLMYPDVLGAITHSKLVTNDLQFAVGVFPKQAFWGQPVEVVVLLQSMVDQNMQVKVGLQLPNTDKKGNPVVIDTPKSMMAVGLRPGEVGVLRMPIIAQPPTPPGSGYPIRVAVRFRTPDSSSVVRPPDGGPPPSVLDVSPFRLQVLRDVDFSSVKWNDSIDIITVMLDVVAKQMPTPDVKPHYETLWTNEKMAEERKLVMERIEDARLMATRLVHGSSYPELLKAVQERFANRDLPLHPGEAHAITKIMTYTVDEAPTLETSIKLEGTRWFRALCQVLAHDEQVGDMRRGEIFARYLFDAILFDAIGMAFKVAQSKIKDDMGDLNERINYANRVLMWIAGAGQPDLNYIYLPLILGGVIVNRIVMHNRDESPWDLLIQLREAAAGRLRLEVTDEQINVFHMLDALLDEAEHTLTQQRVPRH